ncbi:MAG: ATP-binding protein, partial [Tunicatimonas sp.]
TIAYAHDDFCRQIAKNFPNGAVAILDKNLKYLYTAGEALQQLGLTETSLIGQPMEVVLTPAEAVRLKKEFQRVLRGERFFTNTTIGEETYLISVSPLASSDGSVDRVLAVSQNITEQQTALRQAQESEAQFRTLAESIPGAVYVSTSDQDRKLLYISEGITTLCGYPVEDFVEGRIGAADLIPVDDQQANEETVAKAVADQQPYQLTYRLKHRDGSVCWIEEHGANVVKDGKKYFQGVLFDISEKKKNEEELQKQNEELRRMNGELDHFAYSVSHDLRAPLTSALGLLHLLKIEKDPVQRDQFVALAEQSLHQLNNFIQDIMNLTRNSRIDLTTEQVNLSEMVKEVIASQQQNADKDRVEIRNHIEPTVSLPTDRQRLKIVLNNLISNAIRYHRSGHDRSYVHISANVDRQQTTLRVEDNGIGIEPAHKSKIFDMFYRATNRVPGSGLGLYLVKETVQKLKGHVKVDSQVNQGTTFTVLLPSLEE